MRYVILAYALSMQLASASLEDLFWVLLGVRGAGFSFEDFGV